MNTAVVEVTGGTVNFVGTVNTIATTGKTASTFLPSPYTSGNFRANLAKLTGVDPVGYDAHHIFPQKANLQSRFSALGINIHNPIYGTWWEASDHRS